MGLALVAYELRENNKIAYEEANSAISEKFLHFYELTADPEIRAVVVKSVREEDDLTLEEAQTLSSVLASWIETHYYGFLLQQSGRTSEDFRQFLETNVPIYIDTRHGRAWWENVRNNYPPELADAVDRGLANSDPGRRLRFLEQVGTGSSQ